MPVERQEDADMSRWRAWLGTSWQRWIARILGAILLLALAFAVLIDTSFGHRIVANYIAGLEPESGLRIEIGEITGSLYGKAELHQLTLSDPQGEFVHVPVTELDWRPLHWFTYGLDIRQISFREGTLTRFPEFNPGDPDSPILPGFDIRVDRFEIDRLEIAEGLAGDRREISLLADARIETSVVRLALSGNLGGADRLSAMLEAEPDGDRFSLELDYNAPASGLLAGLTGAEEDWQASVSGEGRWSEWGGQLTLKRAEEQVAGFDLSNRSGLYGADGEILPFGEADDVVGRAAGQSVSLSIAGTFVDRTFDGEIALQSAALQAQGSGSIDLSDNRFDSFGISLALLDPNLLGPDVSLDGARATGTLDGNFSDFSIDHRLEVARVVTAPATFEQVSQNGIARREDGGWSIDLATNVARTLTESEQADNVLARLRLEGTLVVYGTLLQSDDLQLRSPVLSAQLALNADVSRASYAVAGEADFVDLALPELGRVNASSTFEFQVTNDRPWSVEAEIAGRAPRIANGTIGSIAGEDIAFNGSLSAGEDIPVALEDAWLAGEHLELAFDGQLEGERLDVAGSGEHGDYGPLRFSASRQDEAIEADIALDRPFDPAGLEDVRIALSSMDGGFQIDTRGQSLLGEFDGRMRVLLPVAQPVQIAIDRLDVWRTNVTGQLQLEDGLVLGDIGLTGGGLDGSIALLRRQNDVQGYSADIAASNARFGGRTELSIARADIEAAGDLAGDSSSLQGTLGAQGIRFGDFFIGRAAGQVDLTGGRGSAALLIAGPTGSDFEFQFEGEIERDQALVAARGQYRGNRISMPRRARLAWFDDGGWRLDRSQVSFGDGLFQVEAQSAVDGAMQGQVGLVDMPLAMLGMVRPDTGLGGIASGNLEWSVPADGAPNARMNLQIADFTRSGLTLSSRPVDIAANATLTSRGLRLRAVAEEDAEEVGRLDVSIAGMPSQGSLLDRLYDGDLAGSMQFDGPASTIWRLARVDTFDVTGPLMMQASLSGSLADPRISGSLQGDGLRLRSGITGTDVRDISLLGRFTGSSLQLTRFEGTTAESGSVSGSGTLGFADLLERGPEIDIRLAANGARLLDRSDIAATVTGPIRILSDGLGGTIAGRVRIDRGRWQLGRAEAAEAIPEIETLEINLPASRAPAARRNSTWAYMVDARASNQLAVEGMGLQSEWNADIRLRGTIDDPRIGGEAGLVRGDFSFAGASFALERGQIRFDEAISPDPVLDILASSQVDGLDVDVTVTGRATAPVIALSSTPPLPEDELLSRILFGGDLNELTPLDAVQLGSALASLRSGGGIGPINRLRQSAGLDRLRLLAPDPSLDRGTAIAAGRYFTRRIYAELVTDGQGYTATQLEFRLTSWLKLLASVSSLGREQVTLELRKDY